MPILRDIEMNSKETTCARNAECISGAACILDRHMSCYLLLDGKEAGAFSLLQLMAMWTSGQITSETSHWFEGLNEWLPIGTFIEEALEEESARTRNKVARFQNKALEKELGWSDGYYAFLVLLTVLLPIGGFVIGLAGVFDVTKRKQAGQLLAFSIIWSVLVGGALMVYFG